MPWMSPENFKSIRVGVQMQIEFKSWKSELIIIITSNFAGQKNTDQKNVRIPNFFMETEKACLKWVKNAIFVNSNKKLRPKLLGQHFSLLHLGVYFQDQMVVFSWRRHLTSATIVQNFNVIRISGSRDLKVPWKFQVNLSCCSDANSV